MERNRIVIECYLPDEIDATLLKSMEEFVHAIDDSLPKDHIRKNHLTKANIEFYLVYLDKKLQGIVSYSTAYIAHPLTGKKKFISVGGLTYKHSKTPIRSLTKLVSKKHMRKHLGHFWFLKSFLAVAKTVNPRVYDQFDSFFPKIYPSNSKENNSIWQDFLSKHLSQIEKHPVELDAKLVSNKDCFYEPEVDISANFKRYYKSKNKQTDNYFFDSGIFKRENDKIYLTSKSLVVIGEYGLTEKIQKSLKSTLELISQN